jgi:hypothetical protein
MTEKKVVDQKELVENPEALLALVQQSVRHLIDHRPDILYAAISCDSLKV